MTYDVSEDGYSRAEFDGTDWSMGKVRSALNNGGIEVAHNHNDGVDNDLCITVADCFREGNRATVVLDKATALDLLNHINDLLGRPMSHPATAGGFAPSAD